MPDKASQIAFLKSHAQRLREIAAAHKTEVSADLVKLAETIEARIARLEKIS